MMAYKKIGRDTLKLAGWKTELRDSLQDQSIGKLKEVIFGGKVSN